MKNDGYSVNCSKWADQQNTQLRFVGLAESTTLETELPSTERSGILDLYSLSYAYYPVLGFLVAILFGSAISFLTGKVTAASRQTF